MSHAPAIYAVTELVIDFYTPTVSVRAVDDASFHVLEGETVANVGESGSGTTMMTLAPLGLLPEGVAVDLKGNAAADSKNLLALNAAELSDMRGRYFGVFFQDPMSALVGNRSACQLLVPRDNRQQSRDLTE